MKELRFIPPVKVSCGKTNRTSPVTGEFIEKTVSLKQYGLSVHLDPAHPSVRLSYFNQREWDKDYGVKGER